MKMRQTGADSAAAAVKAARGPVKAKEGKRSGQSAGDAPESKKVKTDLL